MNEVYQDYPIREQGADEPRPLDLLQAWGAPTRPPLRHRLRWLVSAVATWLRAEPVVRGGASGPDRAADREHAPYTTDGCPAGIR
jgi:hypothetical protein